MSPIKWMQEMTVGVKELNAQHKELIAICNELEESLSQGEPSTVIDWLLRQLYAYTRYHIASEEELLERAGDPDLDLHRTGNESLLEWVDNLMREFKQGGMKLPPATVSELQQWYQDHIRKTSANAVLS
jgi:hemerythrin